jgi:hypothetical protein
MLAGFIAHQRQGLKVRLGDQAPAFVCPLEEALNLVRCEAAACLSTCASEGPGRLFKAVRVAMSFG